MKQEMARISARYDENLTRKDMAARVRDPAVTMVALAVFLAIALAYFWVSTREPELALRAAALCAARVFVAAFAMKICAGFVSDEYAPVSRALFLVPIAYLAIGAAASPPLSTLILVAGAFLGRRAYDVPFAAGGVMVFVGTAVVAGMAQMFPLPFDV